MTCVTGVAWGLPRGPRLADRRSGGQPEAAHLQDAPAHGLAETAERRARFPRADPPGPDPRRQPGPFPDLLPAASRRDPRDQPGGGGLDFRGRSTRGVPRHGGRRRGRRSHGRGGEPLGGGAGHQLRRPTACAATTPRARPRPTSPRRSAPRRCRRHESLVGDAGGGPGPPRHGDHAHPLAGRLARALPAAGRGQPLLPSARRRADPDDPRPDDGAGADRPGDTHGGQRRADALGQHALELDRRQPDRPRW